MDKQKVSEAKVKDLTFKLYTFNRSLELCARMNYETENIDFIDNLPKGSVLYDLGACEGRFTIYALLRGLKVFSFEPDKNNYHVLSENIKLNGLENAGLFNVGVGAANQKAILQIGQPWPGGHQKVVKHDDVRSDLNFDFKETEEIDIVALDDFIEKNKLEAPTALKIDIDGSEIPFLKGAKQTLNTPSLKHIIFELDKNDTNYSAIIEILEGAGFVESESFKVPNEPTLYNIIFKKK
jgi:FkbM family methyltransferase